MTGQKPGGTTPNPCPLHRETNPKQENLHFIHCQIYQYGYYFDNLNEADSLVKKQMHNFQALLLLKLKLAVS